jgi:hypothetical protein
VPADSWQLTAKKEFAMRTAIKVLQMVIRLDGAVMIILGLVFWSGHALTLIPVHTWLGFLLVVSLWAQALLAARSGVQPVLAVVAIVWGLIVVILGMTQTTLLPGPSHWVIQVLHLLVGVGAIGLGETLARGALAEHPLTTPVAA